MKNDSHNENHEQAKKIKRKYHRILEKLRIKSLLHSDHEAARQIIVELTNYIKALRAIGYRTTDETEPGRSGRLVAITDEWIELQKAKETKRDKLMKSMRNAKTDEDRLKFIRELVLQV